VRGETGSARRNGQAKISESGALPSEESVERVVRDQNAVGELGDARQHEEQLEPIQQLELGRSCAQSNDQVTRGQLGKLKRVASTSTMRLVAD